MATRVRAHRPLKVVAFNAHGIRKQRIELSKLLQGRCIDVALLSEILHPKLPRLSDILLS